jgi:hypothetical protein
LREDSPSLATAAKQLLEIQRNNQSKSPRMPASRLTLRVGN